MSTGIDRIGALTKAFEFAYKSETQGDYYEFGVYQGVSMVRAIKANHKWRNKLKTAYINNFYGFDSFQGLPALEKADQLENYDVFKESQFSDTSVDLVMQNVMKEDISQFKVQLFKGLYSSTLTAASTIEKIKSSKVAIAHIDCDLYSSAKDCLKFLETRILDGAILLFDDWFCYRGRADQGVHKAYTEWLQSSDAFISTEYFNYSWAGKAFILNKK